MPIEILQPFEVGAEGAIKLVKMPLVFHQDGPRQVIEFVHVGEHDVMLERVDQIEQLAHRHRHLGRAHFIEQTKQH